MQSRNSSTVQPVNRSARPPASSAPRVRLDLSLILFVTLLGSYAYFWQSRDWNAASRLMLTYSLVDRLQVEIDGLEEQAGTREKSRLSPRYGQMIDGDLAEFRGHFYTDKAPGQSLLGAVPYWIGRTFGRLRQHDRDRKAIPYWPADYWVTLGTSGVLTAALGVVIYSFCLRLGTSHTAGVLLGLAYGLGTPAFLYATLFYGHQAAAFATTTSFFLLYRAAHEGRGNIWNVLLSGLLAGSAVVVEYQTAVIGAALALYAVLAIRRLSSVVVFCAAAAFAAALLPAYNYRAFGDPLDMGYAHEVSPEFAAVHSRSNPLGLRLPGSQLFDQLDRNGDGMISLADEGLVGPRDVLLRSDWNRDRQVNRVEFAVGAGGEILKAILWGRYRGLVFYAPVLLAAPLGLVALWWRRQWAVALVLVAAVACMLVVNVTYPKWEGGWCTGPRLIVPAIPFAVLMVGGLLGVRRAPPLTGLVAVATLAGGVLILACVAVGGRFPPYDFDPTTGKERRLEPIAEVVLPKWRGAADADSIPIAGGRQFEWNVGRWLAEKYVPADRLPPEPSHWRGLEMAPLLAYWLLMTGVLISRARRARSATATASAATP